MNTVLGIMCRPFEARQAYYDAKKTANEHGIFYVRCDRALDSYVYSLGTYENYEIPSRSPGSFCFRAKI